MASGPIKAFASKDDINSITTRIARAVYAHPEIKSAKATAIKRLHENWTAFCNSISTASPYVNTIICPFGFIEMPSYNGSSNLGTFYFWGTLNLANNQGTIYLNQYHMGPTYVYRNHGASADGATLDMTNVDIE